jgi:gliding motility-associated-like protein
VNDTFIIFAESTAQGMVTTYRIFDRWGQLVYEAYNFPLDAAGPWWDGTSKGQVVDAGAYVYSLEIQLDSGEKLIEKGEVNVLK